MYWSKTGDGLCPLLPVAARAAVGERAQPASVAAVPYRRGRAAVAGFHAGSAAAVKRRTPVERDLFDCHEGCFWPAQVPDQLNHAPNWTAKCASAQKDWRKIDLVFP